LKTDPATSNIAKAFFAWTRKTGSMTYSSVHKFTQTLKVFPNECLLENDKAGWASLGSLNQFELHG
jgi:hypothetical protein